MRDQWTEEEFKNPPAFFRGAPFWAWNNKLDAEQLTRQIHYFKEMGMGGYHIHCRVGLDTPYLGKEFMDCVSACIEEGKKEGLYTYLYDEDRWPSGAAGGIVTKQREYRSRHLLFVPEGMDKKESQDCRLLGIYRIELENGCLKSWQKTEAPVEEGGGDIWRLYLEIAEPTPWHNNQTYVDTLNGKAIEKFIQVTHEAYARRFGEEFGEAVPSIFTDEPQFVRKETLDFAGEKKALVIPYTDSFEDFYQQRFGESFLEHFPEVIWELPEGGVSAARYQYHEGLAELFASSFADTVGSWCTGHGLMLTGHMMEEPTLLSQTSALGEAMRSYRSFGLPGIDMLCDWREYTTAKQAQSAAHQYGREGVLSELYGVTNWDFDFRGHKLQGDWQAALGVTRRVHHLSWVSMEGGAKRDYPSSIFCQSPWYKEYKMVEDHFARVNTAMMRGTPRVRVAVIHPVESYWLHFGPKEQTAQIRDLLEQQFKSITEWLLFGLTDFDFLAESLLAVQPVNIGKGTIAVGEMQYDVILVPGCETLRSTTLAYLESFRKAEGTVIFAGKAPEYVDARKNPAGRKLAEQCVRIPMDKIELLKALEPYREIEIHMPDGRAAGHFLYQMRQDGECRWIFIANGTKPKTQDMTQEIQYHIRLAGKWRVDICDTQTGIVRKCPATVKGGWTEFKQVLDLHDSLLLHLHPVQGEYMGIQTADDAAAGQFVRPDKHREEKLLPQPQAFYLEEPNVLLLDQCEYRFDQESWQETEEILRIDNILRERLGYPKRMEAWPQPWVTAAEKKPEHTVTLRYTVLSETKEDMIYLALEQPGEAEITWNGEAAEKKVCGWYVDECLKKIELGGVQKGRNELCITRPFGKKTNLEWSYLLGKFGVRTAGREAYLTAMPDKLLFGDYTVQGLPFYAGNLKYELAFETEEGSYAVQISKFRAPLLKVSVDGGKWQPVAYAPYEVSLGHLAAGTHRLEIISFGNRINAFGTVHSCDEIVEWSSGPNEWRTQGERYAYEYQLKRMGILKTPVIFRID